MEREIELPVFDLLRQRNFSVKKSVVILGDNFFRYISDFSADEENEDTKEWVRVFEYYNEYRPKRGYSGYEIKMTADERSEYDAWVVWVFFTGATNIKLIFKTKREAIEFSEIMELWENKTPSVETPGEKS